MAEKEFESVLGPLAVFVALFGWHPDGRLDLVRGVICQLDRLTHCGAQDPPAFGSVDRSTAIGGRTLHVEYWCIEPRQPA